MANRDLLVAHGMDTQLGNFCHATVQAAPWVGGGSGPHLLSPLVKHNFAHLNSATGKPVPQLDPTTALTGIAPSQHPQAAFPSAAWCVLVGSSKVTMGAAVGMYFHQSISLCGFQEGCRKVQERIVFSKIG